MEAKAVDSYCGFGVELGVKLLGAEEQELV